MRPTPVLALLHTPAQELHWYKIPKDLPIAAAATMVVK